MRTHTANWDFASRDRGLAQPDSTCPRCSGPCYSGAAPDGGRLYTCMGVCGTFLVSQIDPSLEVEAQANGLRTRANAIEEALRNTPQSKTSAAEPCDELAEIYTTIDRLYLPMETYVDAKREAGFGVGL